MRFLHLPTAADFEVLLGVMGEGAPASRQMQTEDTNRFSSKAACRLEAGTALKKQHTAPQNAGNGRLLTKMKSFCCYQRREGLRSEENN